MKSKFKEYTMITLGVLIMSIGFQYLIIPNDLVPGGVSGISIILKEFIDFNPSIIILVINMLLLGLGLLFLGKDFFLKTLYSSLLFPLYLFLLENISLKFNLSYVDDLFLVAIFGAFSIGIGLGVVLRYGGTTGGVDIPQRILQKYLNIPFSTSLYIIDGTIIIFGVLVFGIQAGMYAIIIMYLSGKVIDSILIGGSSRKAVYIITKQQEQIKESIFESIERGLTQIQIKGGYTQERSDMILCILEQREYYTLRNIVYKIDPSAFMFVSNISEVLGEGFSE